MNKKIWLVISVGIGILAIGFVAICGCIVVMSQTPSARKSGTVIQQTDHQPGSYQNQKMGLNKVSVTTRFEDCEPIWNVSGTMLVDGHLVDKNLCYEIEYDGDPAKRYSMPPYNVPGTNTFTYTNPCTYKRIRIQPGQGGKTSSEYSFNRVPR